METFLNQNIMEGLYDLSQMNFPAGLLNEVIKTFGSLITELDRTFMVQGRIHVPIFNLLKYVIALNEITEQTEKELVQLMFGMSCRLLEYPDLLNILFQERRVDNSKFKGKGVGSTSNVNKIEFNVEQDYPLFNYLLHFVHYEGQTGDYARTALLFCLQTANKIVEDYIINESNFFQVMVSVLGARFTSLSPQLDKEGNLNRFLHSLEFYQKAINESTPRISSHLLESIEIYFFHDLVIPRLGSNNIRDHELETITYYVEKMLQIISNHHLSSRFVGLLLAKNPPEIVAHKKNSQFYLNVEYLLQTTSTLTQPLADIVGPFLTFQSTDLKFRNSLFEILLSRLKEPSELVQESTWGLFYTLLSSHSSLAIPILLSQTLQTVENHPFPGFFFFFFCEF